MFVHLSSTSPYVCDINLGPIEQADRMASAPTKNSITYLELKESFPKFQQARTPLKLLAHDEIPLDTHIIPTVVVENNPSRQPSLQPVWYTEQTIVDDNNEQNIVSTLQEQQQNSIKSSSHHHEFPHSLLPTIRSNSPDVEDEIIIKETSINQPLSMRKSSTFTIEQQSSINVPSSLNESEKENDYNAIMTSTQQPSIKSMHHPTEPSDESFRALEHLLGLGSINQNITMLTTAQESPKSNHESLSLTMVTPTELINQTTASFHINYAPHGGGSLPSSQNILVMPTIESITDPSMNSTMPPPFLVDNSDTDELSSMAGTVISNQESFQSSTEDLLNFTDDEEKQETPKEDTNTEDDSNFSFELNDFANNSNETCNEEVIQPPIITIRPPTSADVAFRALIKPRTSGRLSQPVKTDSPLAKTSKMNVTANESVPTRTSRVLRSNISQTSESSIVDEVNQSSRDTINQSSCTEPKLTDDDSKTELISLPEDKEIEQESANSIFLNLMTTKDLNQESPNSATDADCSASCSSSFLSNQQDSPVPSKQMVPIVSCEYSYNTPTAKTTRSSERRRSIITNRQSHTRTTHSAIPSIPEQQATISDEESNLSSRNTSLASFPSESLKSILSVLSTNPTVISEGPPIILRKSLAGSASPSPNPTPIITIRKSDRLSSNRSPRRSIKPLQSSTPSSRAKSLQMVSIGEKEQILTTVPQKFIINTSINDIEMFDKEQQVDMLIQTRPISHEGVQTSPERRPRLITIDTQTTPSLERSSLRYVQTTEQQTTPIVKRSSSSSSCQTTPITISIQHTSTRQIETTSTLVIEEDTHQQQVTPMNSKSMMHLRRNVRFQFTPSTDARLAAKEKLEEDLKLTKQEIPIENIPQISTDNEREEDTEDEIKKITKTKKKTTKTKKKKHITKTKDNDSSEETIESPICNQPQPTIANTHEEEKSDDIHPIEIIPLPQPKISKRSNRHEKKSSPIPELILIDSSPVQTKRTNRKRANQKSTTSLSSPPLETTSPVEPVSKRAKIVENKPPLRVPSPEPLSKRNRSKTPVISNNNIQTVSSSENKQPSRKTKKTSSETNPPLPINNINKRKTVISTGKRTKRRLHNVEQDEGLNTADEEELISHPIDLNQKEREKIEGLTVVELKNRLTTHGENIPKGIRKADLIALLIKIETDLLQERKEPENVTKIVAPTTNSTSRKTRRKRL